MYVAMTRAKEGLYFTSADDYGGKIRKKVSRFIVELGFPAPEPAGRAAAMETALAPPATPPPVPKRPEYEPPPYFSFTQLAAYARCPLQYKFAHVIRIPVFGKPQLSFGKTIHATLERFLKELAQRRAAAQGSLFGEGTAAPTGAAPSGPLPVSREELLNMYEEAWQDDWYPDRPTKEKFRQKGREILSLFHAQAEKNPPDPLYLEKDFTLKIGAYAVRGKIDRIDRLAGSEKEVEIVDYKTGSPKEGGELRPEDKRQLLLYQAAVARLFGPRRAG